MKSINNQLGSLFVMSHESKDDQNHVNNQYSQKLQEYSLIQCLSPRLSQVIFKKTTTISTYSVSKLFLLIIIYCCLLQKATCHSPALDSPGMFYTQQLTIQNNFSQNPTASLTMNFTQPYSGWKFTSTSVNSNYVALLIQDINIQVDNSWMSFNIMNQQIHQNHIQLQIQFCYNTSGFFVSVTLRMLAVDYDSTGTGDSLMRDNFFIQTETLYNQNDKIFAYKGQGDTSTISQSNTQSFVFLTGFSVMSTSIFKITNVKAYYYNSNPSFNLSIQTDLSTQQFNATFTIITINIYPILGNNFNYISTTIPFYNVFVYSDGAKGEINNSNIVKSNYPYDSSRPGYNIGQTLVFGMSDFYLNSINILNITSSINSTRIFNSTSSNIYLKSGIYDNIWMKWIIIQKNICQSSDQYYVIDNSNGTTYCTANCYTNMGYYQLNPNIYTCYSCSNPHCKTCDATQPTSLSCLSCDSSSRQLANTSLITNDCVPKYSTGYYQNNQAVAGTCNTNCSTCLNNLTCQSCQSGYYFSNQNQSQCLQCTDIFQLCSVCANNSNPSECTQCQTSYYRNDNSGLCQACQQNCSTCSNNQTCQTCKSGYYFSNQTQCLQCKDIFQYCYKCDNSNPSNCIQCYRSYYLIQNRQCLTCQQIILNCTYCDPNNITEAKCLTYLSPFLVVNNSCQAKCGDGVIQFEQECDDNNLISNDGCNSQCKIQPNFSCQQILFLNYTDLNTSICIYTGEIIIVSKYLEKFQTENKVQFRFNILPKLAVFQTGEFAQRIINALQVNWTGYSAQSLEAFKVENGLEENGLFAIRFSYDIEWSDSIQLLLSLEHTNLRAFAYNGTRLLTEIHQTYNLKQANLKFSNQVTDFRLNARLLSNQNASISQVILSQKSDNNLQMYSNSYDMFSYSKYFTYFLINMVWLMWICGLFFGKLVVIDLMIALQIGLLCIMTTGVLTPGFSGMMIQKFVLFGFAGFYSISYEDREIYQPLSPQIKSAKITVHPAQNLSLMLILLAINLLIGIIAKIINKFSEFKKYLLEIIIKYSFSQFNLYILLPFMINGNISTVIFAKSLFISSSYFSILDVLALIAFNVFQVVMFVMQYKRSKIFGQFRTQFLRFSISQQFYMFVMIYLFFLSIIFALLFGTIAIKYCCVLPILIYVAIIIFNKIKSPYLQDRHNIRSYILYGAMILLILLIQIQNIINSTFFKNSLPLIVMVIQSILILANCFYLFQSIRVEGISKFLAFLQHGKQNKGQMALYDQQKEKIQEKIDEINRNYYQNQSKLLKDFKQLYKPTQFNFYEEYTKLGQYIYEHASPQNKEKPKLIITEKDKQKMQKILKDPKMMKMSLQSYMINKSSKNLSPTYRDIYNTFQNPTTRKELKRQKVPQNEPLYNGLSKIGMKKQARLQDYKQTRIQQNFDSNKSIKKQEDYPEELITSYKIHELFKKQVKKEKKISTRNALVTQRNQTFKQKIFKKHNNFKQQQPQQKLPVITYQLWLEQLQRQDQEAEKEKRMKEWQDKQWLQEKEGVKKQQAQKQK